MTAFDHGFVAGYEGYRFDAARGIDYIDGYLHGQQQELVDHEAGVSGRTMGPNPCQAFVPSTMGAPRTCARCRYTDDEHHLSPR